MPSRVSPEKLFQTLALWPDKTPRGGPAQMACDEALLQVADLPVLRIFRWESPWISIGYFVPFAEAQSLRPELPVCRRWTGGGIVIHDGDLTFSLVIPSREPLASLRPVESYRKIHETIVRVMTACGTEASLADGRSPSDGQCFAAPVIHDVVADGRKIAGGAQRRTRRGLLHQGSIQNAELGTDFTRKLGEAFAEEIIEWTPPHTMEEITRIFIQEKYGAPEFLAGRSRAKSFTGRGRPVDAVPKKLKSSE